jgi:hypothetical protein
MSQYRYSPLSSGHDSIRLLRLMPDEDETANIQCELFEYSLQKSCEKIYPYEALSYVWGSPDEKLPIFIHEHRFDITVNLRTALSRLRNHSLERILWVDAICIDQENFMEKTHQVNMMRSIYKKCMQCLVWLGEIPIAANVFTISDADAALDFITLCAELSESQKRGITVPPSLSTRCQLNGARKAFVSLTGNTWWSRIWTIQEAVLPPKVLVQWGSLSLPWSIIRKAAFNLCLGIRNAVFHLYSEQAPLVHDIFCAFNGTINDFTGPIRGLDIAWSGENPLDLFQRWRHRNATDPRDKVYALMGLMRTMSLPTVQSCDYGIGTVSLYTIVTIDLIALDGGLRPLVGLRPKHSPDLPTWAIDLARRSDVESSYSWWDHSHRYTWFNASWDKTLEWDRLEGGTVLSLYGILVGHVEDVGSASIHANVMEASNKELADIIGSWKNVMARYLEFCHPHPEYPNGFSFENAFWRTMISDLVTAEFPRRRAEHTDSHLVSEFYKNGTLSEILTSLRCMVLNQAFFITTEGYIGIGSPDMVRGDEVWVLFGGKVPFILRSTGNAGNRQCKRSINYTLVGNAYVHGIMDGEAVEQLGHSQQNVRLH